MLVKTSSATRAVILRLVIAVAVTTVGACAATENPFNGACGIQVRVPPPTGTRFAADQVTAMSPDGSTLVFEAVGSGGVRRLWAYSMRTAISRQIPGSEEGRFPFWSPDGSELGFFSQGQIKRTNLTLDGVTVVCEACDGREGTWNRDGLILFASAATNGIDGVNTAGGMPPVQITAPDARIDETAHRWPLFLPDGVHFVYTAWGKGPYPAYEAYLGSIRSPEKVPVNLNGKRVAYHDPGAMVFYDSNVLLSAAFDPKTFEVLEWPRVIAHPVKRPAESHALFSVSQNGDSIAYWQVNTSLVWTYRSGEKSRVTVEPGAYSAPRLSPSGMDVAYDIGWGAQTSDIYVYNLRTENWRRLTEGPGRKISPVWNPNGRGIIFSANHLEDYPDSGIYEVSTGPEANVRLVLSGTENPSSISMDGNWLAVSKANDFRIMSFDGEEIWGRPGREPALSPDGLWLAYHSNRNGSTEVYVTSANGAGEDVLVSAGGGQEAVWSEGGRSLWYRKGPVLVALRTQGQPGEWAQTATTGGLELKGLRHRGMARQFDVSADGSRVIHVDEDESSLPASLTVLIRCETK